MYVFGAEEPGSLARKATVSDLLSRLPTRMMPFSRNGDRFG